MFILAFTIFINILVIILFCMMVFGKVKYKLSFNIVTFILMAFTVLFMWYVTPIKAVHSVIRPTEIIETSMLTETKTLTYNGITLNTTIVTADTAQSGVFSGQDKFSKTVSINILGDTLNTYIKKE